MVKSVGFRTVCSVLAGVLIAVSLIMLSPRVTVSLSKGLVSISFATQVAYASPDDLTNSPTTNTGTAWTNPDRAYDDNGAGYANITSNNPSGSNVWGTYGFAFTTENITQVRVRYDAWSVGYQPAATSQTRVPTADNTVSGTWTPAPSSPTTRWDKVDETTPDNANYIVGLSNNDYITFGFTAFSVPAGSTITNLKVYFTASDNVSGTNKITGELKVNGTQYANAVLNDPPAPGSWTTFNSTWTQNPNTLSYWTVDDINGVGAAAELQEFGVKTTDATPDVNCSMVYAEVNYTPPMEYNDQIKVDVSWNGGGSWSATQDTTLTSAEVTTWYDVTGVTTWNGTKLSDSNLKVRALAQMVGGAEVVRLDWLPVEVTYTPSEPAILVDPTSYDFGIVAEGSTTNTTTNFFTVNNTSTMQTDQTISVTTATWSGGNGWKHNDTGVPGDNATAILSNNGTWGVGDIIVRYDLPDYIYEDCPANTPYSFGLSLWAPNVFYDGDEKTITVRITAVPG